MGIKPILFNTEMVRAILDGRKTRTRRLIKCKDGEVFTASSPLVPRRFTTLSNAVHRAPYSVGDILWVRETWYRDAGRYMYRANYVDNEKFYRDGKEVRLRWSPSIHMPKDAARIFLWVTAVWVERLRDIDVDEVPIEGVLPLFSGFSGPIGNREDYYKAAFAKLWNSTIKTTELDRYGWDANPWVWVIEFERVERPEAW